MIPRRPAAFPWLLLLTALPLAVGCDPRKSYTVRSEPPGAAITVDGEPAGLTPATLLLDTRPETRVIVLKRPGFAPFEQRIVTKPLLEGTTENCAAVACSPCCFFVPLALCYERTFSPKMISAMLEREGQGLEVVCRPVGAQVWIDGVLVAQTEAVREETMEGNARIRAPSDYGLTTVSLEPKVVKVEIKADGYASRELQVLIRSGEFVHLKLDLTRKDAP